MSGAPTAVIRERGYRPYDGPRLPAVSRAQLVGRRSLGLLVRQPWVIILLIFACFPTLIFGAVIYIQSRMQALGGPAPPVAQHLLDLLLQPYGNALLAFGMALVAGGAAISDDIRAGATQFYFSRPLAPAAYALGKLLPVLLLVALTLLVPVLLVALLQLSISASASELAARLQVAGEAALVGVLQVLALSLPALALSSLTSSSGYARGGFAALYLLPWAVGKLFASATRGPWPALLSIPAHLDTVGRALLGLRANARENFPVWVSALALALLLAGAAWVLRRRLGRVEALIP